MSVVDKVIELLNEQGYLTVKYKKDSGAIARINFLSKFEVEHCIGIFSSLKVTEMNYGEALLLISNVESSIISVE